MLNDLAALYVGSPLLFAGSVFVLGLVVGSFLNVVIYRLPDHAGARMARPGAPRSCRPADAPRRTGAAETAGAASTLSTPRSACPSCKAPIKAWQNIPVRELAGPARPLRGLQGAASRARYPLVELATGLLPRGWPGASASARRRPARSS